TVRRRRVYQRHPNCAAGRKRWPNGPLRLKSYGRLPFSPSFLAKKPEQKNETSNPTHLRLLRDLRFPGILRHDAASLGENRLQSQDLLRGIQNLLPRLE